MTEQPVPARVYEIAGGLLAPIAGTDSFTLAKQLPAYSCPDCGQLVVDQDRHDQFHDTDDEVIARTIDGAIVDRLRLKCHCPEDEYGAAGYWFCPVHQRAAYQGDILGDGGVLRPR